MMNSSDDTSMGGAAPVRQGRGRGRRPADSGTRAAVEAAARRQFAGLGYDRTTLRSIAREADVDPALVTYFFGSKQRLFVEVVELPFDPAVVIPQVIGASANAGEALARVLATVLDEEVLRARLVGLVRAAASEPEAAEMVRDLITRQVVRRVVDALGSDDADLRAGLVGSQIIGLVMARCVVGLEPLASLSSDDLVAAIAPNLQRYLTGRLDGPG